MIGARRSPLVNSAAGVGATGAGVTGAGVNGLGLGGGGGGVDSSHNYAPPSYTRQRTASFLFGFHTLTLPVSTEETTGDYQAHLDHGASADDLGNADVMGLASDPVYVDPLDPNAFSRGTPRAQARAVGGGAGAGDSNEGADEVELSPYIGNTTTPPSSVSVGAQLSTTAAAAAAAMMRPISSLLGMLRSRPSMSPSASAEERSVLESEDLAGVHEEDESTSLAALEDGNKDALNSKAAAGRANNKVSSSGSGIGFGNDSVAGGTADGRYDRRTNQESIVSSASILRSSPSSMSSLSPSTSLSPASATSSSSSSSSSPSSSSSSSSPRLEQSSGAPSPAAASGGVPPTTVVPGAAAFAESKMPSPGATASTSTSTATVSASATATAPVTSSIPSQQLQQQIDDDDPFGMGGGDPFADHP